MANKVLIAENKQKIESIALIEVNREKAIEWYSNKEGLSIEDVSFYPFFESLQEVFEWIYMDENDSHDDTICTLRTISSMDVSAVVEAGVNSIVEYMALDWERLAITPYGYLAIEI